MNAADSLPIDFVSGAGDQLELIATSAFGVESIVRHELEALGYQSSMLEPGRQLFVAPPAAVCRANIFLRCAERLLIRLGHFQADDFERLFEETKRLPWERWIGADGNFPVVAKSIRSQLTSLPAVQRCVKRAVVERLRAAHQRETLAETGPRYRVEVALLNDQATLTLDTSGEGLHRRGYRARAGQAPLRETLAACMIALSRWTAEMPWLDPFCGSGTLAIEAAMKAQQIAPGVARSFVAESWPQLPAELWHEAREEAKSLQRPACEEKLVATDCDRRVLATARQNAELAGVADAIHFQQRNFADLTSKRKFGCLITNPPYGHRLEDLRTIEPLYRSIPLVLRRLPTWSHYILTSYPEFERVAGQSANKRRKLYNGRIECHLYQFHGPRPPKVVEPHSEPTANSDEPTSTIRTARRKVTPTFGGLKSEAERQSREFANRLRKRDRHLRKWPSKGITCYRLYERDIPEVPLVVDRYEDWLHLAEFTRPHERTVAQHADWLDLMKRTAAETLDVDPTRVALKERRRQRGSTQYVRQSQSNHELIVQEGGLKFSTNMVDFVDTGLFLDHRKTRAMVRELAADRRVLNLFGYTGTFSVYAAAGNAASTLTVDLSSTYLDWARRNFELNGFSCGQQHRLQRGDAMTFLRDLHPDVLFDLAVVDPPTFSNSKSTKQDWDVQKDHVALLQSVARRISSGGIVFFSTNFRRFKLADELGDYQSVHEISRQTVPDDFRNRRIHRCWRLEVR